MNSDLFMAILAMDSYNRGYNAGIDLGNNSDASGTQIGNVSICKTKGDAEAEAVGFYAIAYEDSWGNVTISYRGTDILTATDNGEGSTTGGDIYNGWGVGRGSPSGAEAALAFQFYSDVLYSSGVSEDRITLTGHSLGGGLAGFVADVYRGDAVIFDNMPFESAANAAYLESAVDPDLRTLIYGTQDIWSPSISGIKACPLVWPDA